MLGYKSDEALKVERIMLDVIRMGMTHRIDKFMLNPMNTVVTVEEQLGRLGGQMVVHLQQKIASQTLDVIKFKKPASWWQHWKEEKAPKWFVKKYPVKYVHEEYKVSALYPKVAMPEEHRVIVTYKME